MATITVGELLTGDDAKAKGLSFEDIVKLIATASPAVIAILNAQVPGLAIAITAVNLAISAYNSFKAATAIQKAALDVLTTAAPPPVGLMPASAGLLAAEVSEEAGGDALVAAKDATLTIVTDTTVEV